MLSFFNWRGAGNWHDTEIMLNVFTREVIDSSTKLVRLDAEESAHLVRVRRARPGEAVCVYDGRGHIAEGVLEEANAKAATVQVQRVTTAPELSPKLVLAQVMPKGKSMDLVVQKATELGAGIIQPLTSEHCEVSIEANKAERKQEKWQTIALESVKQCGTPYLPEVLPVLSLKAYLKREAAVDRLRLIAALLPETQSPRYWIEQHPQVQSCEILVGPEGDFSKAEYEAALEAGYKPTGLGPLVLRAETAGLAALAIVGSEFRELRVKNIV